MAQRQWSQTMTLYRGSKKEEEHDCYKMCYKSGILAGFWRGLEAVEAVEVSSHC
jgi:hypothetical protein